MEKYPHMTYQLMRNEATTLAYYESDKKKPIFAAGKRYEILHKWHDVWNFGFVVMEHIPVLKDAIPGFEKNFTEAFARIEEIPSLLSARLLKEHKKQTYVFMTQWSKAADYESWQKEQEEKQTFFAKKTRTDAYFANRPFTNRYQIIVEE